MSESAKINSVPPEVREKQKALKERLPELRAALDQEFADRHEEFIHSAELADAERQMRLDLLSALRALRLSRGLTEADVERAAGMPKATISTMEANPRSDIHIGTLQCYAAALGMRLVVSLVEREGHEVHQGSSAATV